MLEGFSMANANIKRKKRGLYQLFFKRFFDILLSLIAIIVLLPIMIIVYILSLIILRGNPIFKQYRPGKNNKIFAMYKFRSMTNKKDKDGNLLPDKDRITTWGKILRKTSIDELPQLFNIFKGDMSIVGPRPRLIKDLIFYDEEVLNANTARPGIAGPAQVYDPGSEQSWDSVFKRDVEYCNNVTLLNDIKLFFGTFLAVFKHRSASGAEANSKKREYYYADQLLLDQKITKEQYAMGLAQAEKLNGTNLSIVYNPSLHTKEESNDNK